MRRPAVAAVVALVLGLAVLPAGGAAPRDLLDEVLARGFLFVSTDPNYAPQSFINARGEMDGFDVDVAKEVARRLGVRVQFVTPAWEAIVSGRWGGRWDVSIGSMTITEDRQKVLHFTPPYYFTPAQFAVHKANTRFRAVTDLAGRRVGVCGGCTYELYLRGTLRLVGETVEFTVRNAVIRTYETDADAIQDLALGDGVRLDAVLSALPTLVFAIKRGVPIRLLGDPVYYEHLAFAVDRHSLRDPTRFVQRLGEIVRAMHADGTLTRLSLKWYGVDLTKKK